MVKEGIYKIKTIKIELKISDKVTQKVVAPYVAVSILREIYKGLDVDQEHFVILSLDSANNIRGYKVINSGGQSEANPDKKIIFKSALLLGAANIIVSHNHPSNNREPSAEDRIFTGDLVKCGEMLGIKIQDHIIITNDSCFSFNEDKSL